ncbi:MAG: Ig-like domain-containing protein [Verrucomicrobiae bacterium]|nr:Ig-like domain-containing protein [Verrucomicrobiae bacterium]
MRIPFIVFYAICFLNSLCFEALASVNIVPDTDFPCEETGSMLVEAVDDNSPSRPDQAECCKVGGGNGTWTLSTTYSWTGASGDGSTATVVTSGGGKKYVDVTINYTWTCSEGGEKTISVSGGAQFDIIKVEVESEYPNVCVGEETSFEASGGQSTYYNWSSSDSSVAMVDGLSGVVTGIDDGTATIRALDFMSGCSGEAEATVILIEVKAGKSSISVNEKTTFTAEGGDGKYVWESFDEEVAVVDDFSGVVTGIGPGSTTIRAWDNNLCNGKADITVKEIAVKIIGFDKNVTWPCSCDGAKVIVGATVTPLNDNTVTWSLQGNAYGANIQPLSTKPSKPAGGDFYAKITPGLQETGSVTVRVTLKGDPENYDEKTFAVHDVPEKIDCTFGYGPEGYDKTTGYSANFLHRFKARSNGSLENCKIVEYVTLSYSDFSSDDNDLYPITYDKSMNWAWILDEFGQMKNLDTIQDYWHTTHRHLDNLVGYQSSPATQITMQYFAWVCPFCTAPGKYHGFGSGNPIVTGFTDWFFEDGNWDCMINPVYFFYDNHEQAPNWPYVGRPYPVFKGPMLISPARLPADGQSTSTASVNIKFKVEAMGFIFEPEVAWSYDGEKRLVETLETAVITSELSPGKKNIRKINNTLNYRIGEIEFY